MKRKRSPSPPSSSLRQLLEPPSSSSSPPSSQLSQDSSPPSFLYLSVWIGRILSRSEGNFRNVGKLIIDYAFRSIHFCDEQEENREMKSENNNILEKLLFGKLEFPDEKTKLNQEMIIRFGSIRLFYNSYFKDQHFCKAEVVVNLTYSDRTHIFLLFKSMFKSCKIDKLTLENVQHQLNYALRDKEISFLRDSQYIHFFFWKTNTIKSYKHENFRHTFDAKLFNYVTKHDFDKHEYEIWYTSQTRDDNKTNVSNYFKYDANLDKFSILVNPLPQNLNPHRCFFSDKNKLFMIDIVDQKETTIIDEEKGCIHISSSILKHLVCIQT